MTDDAVQSIPDFLAANPVCAPASDQTDKRLRPSPRWGSGRAMETKSKLDMQEPAIFGGISSLKESTAVTSVMSAEGVLIEANVVRDKVLAHPPPPPPCGILKKRKRSRVGEIEATDKRRVHWRDEAVDRDDSMDGGSASRHLVQVLEYEIEGQISRRIAEYKMKEAGVGGAGRGSKGGGSAAPVRLSVKELERKEKRAERRVQEWVKVPRNKVQQWAPELRPPLS
eukprot:gene2516-3032_t